MDRDWNVRWIHGSPDCSANSDPALQVHAFDRDTYVLRMNKCWNFEAPFLYLLLGAEKALLLDTGADPGPRRELPLRRAVDVIIADRRTKDGRPLERIVAHTHGHGDHRFGDMQFAGQPHTTVAPTSLGGVKSFFGLDPWPEQPGALDLGDRPITILAIPGHEPTHLAFYDARTQILISGDTVYPGFLFIHDWREYRRSIARLVRFSEVHPVRYVLGAHIEMTRTKKVAYPYGTTYQPEEHVLQLSAPHLTLLHAALETLGDAPARLELDDFIVQPSGV